MNDLDDYRVPDAAPERERERSAVEKALDRGLPSSIEAERTILGAILLDNQAFNEAAEAVEYDDFSLDSHQQIFRSMSELIDAGHAVDIVTLAEELRRRKIIENIGGVAYLASLTEGLPRMLSIGEYVATVKSKSQLRRMINLCELAITRAVDQSEPPLGIIEDIESDLLEIAQESNAGKLRTIYDSVVETGGPDKYIAKITEPSQKPGLSTGYIDLDRMTGGLQKSELTIIAARPSVGKSALAINIAENVAVGTDNVVALFSLEMSRAAVEGRFMAARARVDVKRATSGEYLSGMEREKLAKALNDLVEAKIFIDETAVLTPTQIRAKCRRLKQREKRLDLVILDYVQLVSCGQKAGTREQEVAIVSRSMKALAKEMDVPVVALAQINRNSEQRQDKRPILSDLRESGSLEQDGDLIAFLHRDEMWQPDNEDVRGLADLICAKSRNGPTGIVKLAYIKEFTRFENLMRG